MKALVYHGPGLKSWDEKPNPQIIYPGDAIVRMLRTTICGTDLHIMKGDVASVEVGRILGHEGVGIIEEIGAHVARLKKGDHVLISCITSCGNCSNCRKLMYSHCENGGWILGNTIDGTQAEYVRIPYADNSLQVIPENANEDALVMLSDILPTAYECGVLNAKIQPGDCVAIAGAGPVGMSVLLTAQLYSPSCIIMIDIDDFRLNRAKTFGATHLINSEREDAVKRIMQITHNRGVDAAIEAAGLPDTFKICESIVCAGGHIANIGVHGKSVTLHLEELWSKNISITTRLVDTVSTELLFKITQAGKLDPGKLITHHFRLDQILQAYETFEHASSHQALKVILTN